VKGDLIDSFLEKGSGFGRTYNLKFLPLRIDAILASPSVEVEAHRNFDIRLSDHYPIMASFLIH
jgi:endonuclease/exonuclease/phosphatase (EEP) superfamily protein YafD